MSTEYGNTGYIGSWLCGADGTFETPPVITLNFSQSFPDVVPGITITWSQTYGEWATRFRVTAWHGELVVFLKTVDNREVRSVVSGDLRGYDKIAIEVLAWSVPFRRARLEDIFIGVEKTYGKPDLMSYSASMSVDPLSAALPKSEITFQLKNLNGEYNPSNPQGAEKYLMERQEVTVRYGYLLDGEVEWIKAGTYYLSEWETPQNGITATFTARDALEFMSDAYAGPSEGTLAEIATAAFQQAGLSKMPDGSGRWVLDSSLNQISVPNGLDLTEYTISEVLQYVANAGCCVFYQDREGQLHIEPLRIVLTDYLIDRFNSYANAELTLSKQLRAVNVNNGRYLLEVGTTGETQPLSNPLLSDNQTPVAAKWVADYLTNRRSLAGNYRADPRLDPLDTIRNENQFSTATVLVTEVKYTYNGAFRGSYEGRAVDSAIAECYYSGDLFSGEV